MASVAALIVASGTVKDGHLFIRNRAAFDSSVAQFRDGTELEISVTRLRAARSILQNRYYFGVVVRLLSEHTGYSVDEIHDILKAKFLPKELAVTNSNGTIVDAFVIGGSTRQLSTTEFADYCARIQQWAAESVGVVIPDPHEVAACL
jgi:hypothetical protein